MKSKLVIFDLDGTLCNTIEDIVSAIQHSLIEFKIEPISKERIRPLLGKSIKDIFIQLLPEETKDELFLNGIVDFYNNYYLNNPATYSQMYNGIKKVITTLKTRGYYLAVATNKRVTIAERIVKHFFGDDFDVVRGNDGVTPLKPNPTVIHQLQKQFDVDSKNTFYIGDTEIDYLVADNAKVNAIVVTYGYRDKQDLLAKIKGEPIYVDSPNDLLNYL